MGINNQVQDIERSVMASSHVAAKHASLPAAFLMLATVLSSGWDCTSTVRGFDSFANWFHVLVCHVPPPALVGCRGHISLANAFAFGSVCESGSKVTATGMNWEREWDTAADSGPAG